jgi:lipopolysaccharide export system protein LptA
MTARAALFVALVALAPSLPAADGSRSTPVNLRADRIDIDQRTGVSHYIGHVDLRQGTTRITAARAEARSRGNVLERVIAEGQPATFRDQPATLDQPVSGTAGRLEYEAMAQRIHLYREVEIHHARDTLRAGVVDYDLTARHLHAERDAKTRVYMAVVPHAPGAPAGTKAP